MGSGPQGISPKDLIAEPVKYSSVVGSSVTLRLKEGQAVAMLSIMADVGGGFRGDRDAHMKWSMELSQYIADKINGVKSDG